MICRIESIKLCDSEKTLDIYPSLALWDYKVINKYEGTIKLHNLSDLRSLYEALKSDNEDYDGGFQRGLIVDFDSENEIPMCITIYDDYVE